MHSSISACVSSVWADRGAAWLARILSRRRHHAHYFSVMRPAQAARASHQVSTFSSGTPFWSAKQSAAQDHAVSLRGGVLSGEQE